MLENVKALLEKGERERARSALREAVFQTCVARFVSGWTRHPLLAPKSKVLLDAVRDLGEEPLDILDEAHVNLAFERMIPDFALLLDEALADARHELGGKASNVESASGDGFAHMLGWEVGLVAEIAEHAMKAGASDRLSALENLSLADLDGEEARATIVDGLLAFCCACGVERRELFEAAGRRIACGCEVPRARLDRKAAQLKASRDAERGISRCRVCAGIIQLGRAGFMRAGFCGSYCAKRGQELFREHVAREGSWDGGAIVCGCACGASLRAAEGDVGSKRPCDACGLEVWVPAASAATRRGGVQPCAGCGRPRKASAVKCMYCGL